MVGDDTDEPYPLPMYVPFACAAVGAAVAVATGRERTRLDNFMIGGLFTGFASYRDPRANVWQTLMVAAVEGAIWGITDRIVPQIKEALLPAEPSAETEVVA